jgi:hypothetical protein
MNLAMKKWIFSTVLVCSIALLFGQTDTKQMRLSLLGGYPLGFFGATQYGFHAAVNPVFRLSQHWSVEGQVSYSTMTFKRSDDFFGHDGGNTLNFNALVGARLYLIKENYLIRPFIHGLIGYGYSKDVEYNADNILITNYAGPISFSTGLFLEIKDKINIGVGLEGPTSNILVKLGYTF